MLVRDLIANSHDYLQSHSSLYTYIISFAQRQVAPISRSLCSLWACMGTPAFDHAMLRVGAVQQVLASLADSLQYADHVARQAMTLRTIINNPKLRCEIKGNDDKMLQLTSALQGLNVPADVEADLVALLQDSICDQRFFRPFQNYTSVHAYLSQRMWDRLLLSGDKISKLNELMTFLLMIGLSTPSEPTFQMLVAIYLCTCFEESVVESMDVEAKNNELVFVKSCFKQAKSSIGNAPVVLVVTVPPDPATFMDTYPSMSTQLRTDPPVEIPFPKCRLLMVAGSIRLRARMMPSSIRPQNVMMLYPQHIQQQQMQHSQYYQHPHGHHHLHPHQTNNGASSGGGGGSNNCTPSPHAGSDDSSGDAVNEAKPSPHYFQQQYPHGKFINSKNQDFQGVLILFYSIRVIPFIILIIINKLLKLFRLSRSSF